MKNWTYLSPLAVHHVFPPPKHLNAETNKFFCQQAYLAERIKRFNFDKILNSKELRALNFAFQSTMHSGRSHIQRRAIRTGNIGIDNRPPFLPSYTAQACAVATTVAGATTAKTNSNTATASGSLSAGTGATATSSAASAVTEHTDDTIGNKKRKL